MENSISSSTSTIHVSRGRLDEIGMGDPVFTVELIDIMLEDGTERVQKMFAALALNCFEEVGRIAHSLKGAALNVGASSLAQLCADIDDTARKSAETVTREQVTGVETEFEFVKNELIQIKSDLIA